jgi:hypothetical protein
VTRRSRPVAFRLEGRIDGASGATVTVTPSPVRGGYLVEVRLLHRREVDVVPLLDLVELLVERAAKARARLR